jgi:membrane protease YdiL (CAAX protease family)
VIASYSSDFTAKYPIYPKTGNSWGEFLIWESSYAVFFIALEFFFRGFMLFTTARYLGAYAIFVMVIPYVMIHYGKPFAETLGSIIAGTALGTLALRTRSIFGGVLIHVAVAWCMDILAILATR